MKLSLASLPLLASAASAVVVDSLSGVPAGWREVKAALPTDRVTLRLALRQPRAAALEQKVLDVSTPGQPSYGQHLSRPELRSYTAPSARAVADVTAWLGSHGVAAPRVDNDWVVFDTDVRTADRMLEARFAWYARGHDDDGAQESVPALRTLTYSVPDGLAPEIDMIQPTTRFGGLAGQRSSVFNLTRVGDAFAAPASDGVFMEDEHATAAASCSQVTPACLKSLYNISYTPEAANNSVAFCSYLDQYARYKDFTLFENAYVTGAKGENFTVVEINGGLNDQTGTEDSGEANLDVQTILGLTHPIPITEYSTGGLGPLVPTADETSDSNEPYLEFLAYILSLDDAELPQTLSTSYGEEEQSVPREYALKVCNMFLQLGARGVSVLFSSGDSGPGNACVQNTGANATYFQPTFPAGCPYVTAVGGTTGTAPERGVSFSSGGFSIYHARPAWQASAVSTYLASINGTYAAYFNASGRGIPDVAAQGQDFLVYDQGYLSLLSGTSASAPTFAGVVALLNAARRSAGLAPMGFLNPWLYSNAAALNDITTGAGVGCMGSTQAVKAFGSSGARWNATVGWDPVTGLGTPNFGMLLEAAAPGVANA